MGSFWYTRANRAVIGQSDLPPSVESLVLHHRAGLALQGRVAPLLDLYIETVHVNQNNHAFRASGRHFVFRDALLNNPYSKQSITWLMDRKGRGNPLTSRLGRFTTHRINTAWRDPARSDQELPWRERRRFPKCSTPEISLGTNITYISA